MPSEPSLQPPPVRLHRIGAHACGWINKIFSMVDSWPNFRRGGGRANSTAAVLGGRANGTITPRCNWEFQCRGTGHSVKFNWFPVNFHWFPVEYHLISSGIPLNFPVAPGSLVTSDLSLVLAKSAHRTDIAMSVAGVTCYMGLFRYQSAPLAKKEYTWKTRFSKFRA